VPEVRRDGNLLILPRREENASSSNGGRGGKRRRGRISLSKMDGKKW